jgi:hypothetical protein
MTKQILVSSALNQIGEDQTRHEAEYQKKFDTFSIQCKFRRMLRYRGTILPAPSCEDKKNNLHDRGCSINGCPYIREAKGMATGREHG